jgi:hypothetical protein
LEHLFEAKNVVFMDQLQYLQKPLLLVVVLIGLDWRGTQEDVEGE